MIEEQPTVRGREAVRYEVVAGERASEAVVEAVSIASNADPRTMAPLTESVDPDALDALFADRYDGTARPGGTVRFSYFGYDVVVTDDERVWVFGAPR